MDRRYNKQFINNNYQKEDQNHFGEYGRNIWNRYDRNLFWNNENYSIRYNEYHYQERYEEVQIQSFSISNYLMKMLNCIINHNKKRQRYYNTYRNRNNNQDNKDKRKCCRMKHDRTYKRMNDSFDEIKKMKK